MKSSVCLPLGGEDVRTRVGAPREPNLVVLWDDKADPLLSVGPATSRYGVFYDEELMMTSVKVEGPRHDQVPQHRVGLRTYKPSATNILKSLPRRHILNRMVHLDVRAGVP